jgi:hypothetical protein
VASCFKLVSSQKCLLVQRSLGLPPPQGPFQLYCSSMAVSLRITSAFPTSLAYLLILEHLTVPSILALLLE